MSTYFKHFGNVNIKEVIELTNWKIGVKEGVIDIDRAIELQFFYITNGKHYLWVDVNKKGVIKSFTRYGNNEYDFLFDLIGYSVSEYDYQSGIIDNYVDDDLNEWLEDNTYFEELENVA